MSFINDNIRKEIQPLLSGLERDVRLVSPLGSLMMANLPSLDMNCA